MENINSLISYDVFVVDGTVSSVLKACDFINKTIFETSLFLNPLFQDIGVSMIGVLYYSLHYLEQIKLYNNCLIKLESKLRTKKNSRKNIINLEKKTDEIEDLYLKSKYFLDLSLVIINKNIPILNDFLKAENTKLAGYFRNSISADFLSLLKQDDLIDNTLCLGFKLDKNDSYKGFYNYMDWFEDESAYLSKLYSDIMCFFVLPMCINHDKNNQNISNLIPDNLRKIYHHVIDCLGLEINPNSNPNSNSNPNPNPDDIFSISDNFDIILSLILKYFLYKQNQVGFSIQSTIESKEFEKLYLIISSVQMRSFDKIISNYCNNKLLECQGERLYLSKLFKNKNKNIINNNLFTKNSTFIYNS